MDYINEIIKKATEQFNIKIESWLESLWVTVENIHKYKLKVTKQEPEFTYKNDSNGYSIKWKLNCTYYLYPARWRNAKKPISSLTI